MICTRPVGVDSPVSYFGEACPECGHTMAGHPGVINPSLDACLVCEVQAVVQQLRDAATSHADVVDQRLASLESWTASHE